MRNKMPEHALCYNPVLTRRFYDIEHIAAILVLKFRMRRVANGRLPDRPFYGSSREGGRFSICLRVDDSRKRRNIT